MMTAVTNPSKSKVEEPKRTQEDLMEALYWMYDAFDRATMLFFLVGNTAKKAMKQLPLDDNKIEVGVRELEWTSGSKGVLDAFIGEKLVKDEGKIAQYKHLNGVPVFIHVYPEDPCVTQCDSIVYEYEFFKVPNPYKAFEKLLWS